MASLIVPLISSFYSFSFVKTAISYRIYYSTDKKADRRIKNILKRLVCIEQMLTFVDEKKGTIKFVTIFFKLSSYPATHYTSFLYFIRIIYYNVRAYLLIYSHTYFLSTLYSTLQAALQNQEKSPGEALFYIRRIITFIADFYIRKVYITKKKSILYFFVYIAFFLCNKFIS